MNENMCMLQHHKQNCSLLAAAVAASKINKTASSSWRPTAAIDNMLELVMTSGQTLIRTYSRP
jgi:hypothetical protein